MKKYDISYTFFKPTIILFSVSLFLFLLSWKFNFGIIGVIVFIRATIMLISQLKEYKRYSVEENSGFYTIKRNGEEININILNIISISKKKRAFKSFDLIIETQEKIGYPKSKYILKNLKEPIYNF
jgi:hypothetical protein